MLNLCIHDHFMLFCVCIWFAFPYIINCRGCSCDIPKKERCLQGLWKGLNYKAMSFGHKNFSHLFLFSFFLKFYVFLYDLFILTSLFQGRKHNSSDNGNLMIRYNNQPSMNTSVVQSSSLKTKFSFNFY